MSKISNDDLSYLIVRSLTEGEVIKTIDPVDRDIIDDMADTDRQIVLNFLENAESQRKEEAVKELQEILIAEINKELAKDGEKNVQLLDVLNRLLGTVSSYLLAKNAA